MPIPTVITNVANVEQHVTQLAALRAVALVSRDSSAIENMLAADFVYTNSSGTVMNREQYLREYVQSPDVVWHSQEIEAVKVRVYENIAILTGLVHDRATFGTTHELDAHFRTTQVYLRDSDDIWKYVAGHTSSSSDTVKLERK
jgi:ketosteroid isomerase-like protein